MFRAFRILLCLLAGAGALLPARGQPMVGDESYARVQRGQYLARAADCAACHTADGGQPFAGGRPIPTPFGTIYSPNITPDQETGIGKWSADDLYRALHEGMDREGEHLYPAMPYPWYTKLTRDDVDALRAYLATLEPVHNDTRPPELPWPLSWRGGMAVWNGLFFKPGAFRPDPRKSGQWNRGAYLVEGAGHCGACHTSKNILGAAQKEDRLAGGDAGEHWYASDLTGDLRDGLGKWSAPDIVEYLKTGANRFTAAAGPMVDVVKNSTRHLSDDDLKAIAVYLKDLPREEVAGKAESSAAVRISSRRMIAGAALYQDHCAACHMEDGRGLPNVFPSLQGSAAVQGKAPDTILHLVLQGGHMAGTPARPVKFAMPPFNAKLDDAQIADLVTYLRNAWGNRASAVDAGKVSAVRKDLAR